MTEPGAEAPTEPPLDQRKPGVFLSWSGPESNKLSSALKALITRTFGGELKTWQSDQDLQGSNFRDAIRDAVQQSDVAVVSIGPSSLSSRWIMYEAGAFFGDKDAVTAGSKRDRVFAIGCGVAADALERTPLGSLHLWDSSQGPRVKALLESIGRAVHVSPKDFANRFDAAWSAFAEEVRAIHDGLEAQREVERRAAADADARRRRQHWSVLLLAVGLLVLAGGTTAWALWPPPPPPPPCTTGNDEARANCRWEAYLKAYANSGPVARKGIAKRVSRRPFAVVGLAAGCTEGADVSAVKIVVQGDSGDHWSMPVIFAKSSSENANEAHSAAVVKVDDRLTVARPRTCVDVSGGTLQIRHIGTLSDDEVCQKFDAVRRAFAGAPAVAGVPAFHHEFVKYLEGFGLGSVGSGSTAEGWLQEWLKACAVHEVKP